MTPMLAGVVAIGAGSWRSAGVSRAEAAYHARVTLVTNTRSDTPGFGSDRFNGWYRACAAMID